MKNITNAFNKVYAGEPITEEQLTTWGAKGVPGSEGKLTLQDCSPDTLVGLYSIKGDHYDFDAFLEGAKKALMLKSHLTEATLDRTAYIKILGVVLSKMGLVTRTMISPNDLGFIVIYNHLGYLLRMAERLELPFYGEVHGLVTEHIASQKLASMDLKEFMFRAEQRVSEGLSMSEETIAYVENGKPVARKLMLYSLDNKRVMLSAGRYLVTPAVDSNERTKWVVYRRRPVVGVVGLIPRDNMFNAPQERILEEIKDKGF